MRTWLFARILCPDIEQYIYIFWYSQSHLLLLKVETYGVVNHISITPLSMARWKERKERVCFDNVHSLLPLLVLGYETSHYWTWHSLFLLRNTLPLTLPLLTALLTESIWIRAPIYVNWPWQRAHRSPSVPRHCQHRPCESWGTMSVTLRKLLDRVTGERGHTFAASFMLPCPLICQGCSQAIVRTTVLPTY